MAFAIRSDCARAHEGTPIRIRHSTQSGPNAVPVRAGFTLMEMTVALAILVIVAAIGWTSLGQHLPRYRTMQASKTLESDLRTVRGLAIHANRETRLRLVSDGGDCEEASEWGGSWTMEIGDRSSNSVTWDVLPPDREEDGSDDDQSEGLVDLGQGGNKQSRHACLARWDTLAGPGSGNDDAIVFSPRGWVVNPNGDFDSTGYITLQVVNSLAAEKGLDDAVSLSISRAGAVRVSASLQALGEETADDNSVGITASSRVQ